MVKGDTQAAANVKVPILLEDLLAASVSRKTPPGCYLAGECFFIIECRICCNLFRTINAFVNHKEKVCLKVASETKSDDISSQSIRDDSVTCELCQRQFENKTLLLRHQEYFHSGQSPVKPLSNSSGDLRKRLSPVSTTSKTASESSAASDGMQCQQCTKWFASAEKLKIHLNSDCPNMLTNIRIAQRNGIDKNTFSQGANKIGSISLKCDFCDMQFKLDRTKEKHMQKFHSEKMPKTINKVFSCDQCHRMYSDESSLKRHIESIHSSETLTSNREPKDDDHVLSFKRRRSALENQENTNPFSNSTSSHTTSSAENDKVENDDISIYCDEVKLQCLICLTKLTSLSLLKSHIKTEHHSADSPNADSQVTSEINMVEGVNEKVFEVDLADWTGELENAAGSAQSNLECTMCGRKFNELTDFEHHVTLPHKISIRS